MKIGMVSDSLGHLPFEEMLDRAASLGVEGIEVNAANWTAAPHIDRAGLLADARPGRAALTRLHHHSHRLPGVGDPRWPSPARDDLGGGERRRC